MDVIKTESKTKPLNLETSDYTVVEDKDPPSQEGRLTDFNVSVVKLELTDSSCDDTFGTNHDEDPAPFSFVKCEIADESYDENAVKDERDQGETTKINEDTDREILQSRESTQYYDVNCKTDESTMNVEHIASNDPVQNASVQDEISKQTYHKDLEVLDTNSSIQEEISAVTDKSSNIPVSSVRVDMNKRFTCDICGKNFLTKLSKRHMLTHTGIKPYKCDMCGKCFSLNANLKVHERIHTGEKPFKCDVCNKDFTQLGLLQRHKRIHTGEKPYKCEVCGKSFSDRGNYIPHLRIHSGVRPFKCRFCGKSFSKSGHLKRHSYIHVRGTMEGISIYENPTTRPLEKLFNCGECGKSFAQIGVLNRHKRTHTGEKPFKCDLCGMCFSVRNNLKRHLIVHTGERPYECDICEKRFTKSDHLKSHKNIHMRNNNRNAGNSQNSV